MYKNTAEKESKEHKQRKKTGIQIKCLLSDRDWVWYVLSAIDRGVFVNWIEFETCTCISKSTSYPTYSHLLYSEGQVWTNTQRILFFYRVGQVAANPSWCHSISDLIPFLDVHVFDIKFPCRTMWIYILPNNRKCGNFFRDQGTATPH